jgi:hypothetical protein
VRAVRFLGAPLAGRTRIGDGLGRWRWTAIALSTAAALVSSGCVAVEMTYVHSTSFVVPVATTSHASPAAGPLVAVTVEDGRTEVSPYEVGAKYSSQWGYEGSTIDLKDKVSLADEMARDVAGLLREQGYRAEVSRGAPEDAAEILLTIRIDVFNLLLILGQDVRLEGLLLMDALRRTDSRRWADAVGARFELDSSMYPSDAEFQRCFERLYGVLRDKMRNRLGARDTGLSSPRWR